MTEENTTRQSWRTIAEAAAELRCSRSYVNKLLGKRKGLPVVLPSFLHAHKRFVLQKEIDAYKAKLEGNREMRTPQWQGRKPAGAR